MLVDTESRYVDASAEHGRHSRGPLRPDQLVSVRERQHRQLAGHRFRAVDTVVLTVGSVLLIDRSLDGSLTGASIADVLPLAVATWALCRLVRSMGLYRLGRSESLVRHLAVLAVAVASAAAVALVLRRLLPTEQTSTADVLIGVGLAGAALVVLHTAWWATVARWRSRGLLTPNLVVVGATAHAEELVSSAIERRDMNIIGIFDDRRERSPLVLLGVPVLGDTEAMLRHRVMPYVDLVVVTIDPAATSRVREIMTRLTVLPNRVTLVFDDPLATRRAGVIDQLADAPLLPLQPAQDAHRRAFAKRVQDLVVGVPVLIAFAPLLVLIALAIRLDSPGPVFFRQRRHGFNNEEIVVWKFRTMRQESTDDRAERQVTADDDRVTRVGRILRSTSLDEVPQLLNVISGEMSLVGPRPHAIGMKTGEVESAELVAEYAHRHRIKPGMTGWAAVNGSRGPLHEPDEVTRRVALDVDYIERQSFWLDLRIMLTTIPSMLGDRSAIR